MTNTANHHTPLGIYHAILVTVSSIYIGLYPAIVQGKTTPGINTTTALIPGVQNSEVQVIQVQLKALGYYDGTIDGNYNISTQNAIAKFQKDLKLNKTDGIIDQATRIGLNLVLDGKIKIVNHTSNNIQSQSLPSTDTQATEVKKNDAYILWWRILSLGALGVLAFSVYISHQERKNKSTITETIQPTPNQEKLITAIPIATSSHAPEILPSVEMSLIAKVNVVDDLIENLNNPDPIKRSKAIWDLSQKGDSRAIEPLVKLLGSTDSKQHSLILSALADISIRNFKPIRKALIMSLQHESSEVRQNAIRDLARIHDMIEQINQTLYLSLSDEDPEVQATAKYALKQINALNKNHYSENRASEERVDVLTRY